VTLFVHLLSSYSDAPSPGLPMAAQKAASASAGAAVRLHGYFASPTSFLARIGLNVKEVMQGRPAGAGDATTRRTDGEMPNPGAPRPPKY